MRKRMFFHLAAGIGLAVFGASNAFAGLDSSNHSQWDEDFFYLGFGGPAPAGAVEYSVGFSTIGDFDGRVISNAAVTDGGLYGLPLTTISTSLFTGTDANLYKFKITDPASFSASIPSTSLILALFDSTGKGLAASIGGTADTITGANAGVTSPGTYYIGIANPGMNPQNAAAENIFGLTGAAGVFTPVTGDAVLGTSEGTAWTTGSAFAGFLQNVSLTAASSTISLTGSGFVLPEPASLAMLAMGGIGLIRRRRQAI